MSCAIAFGFGNGVSTPVSARVMNSVTVGVSLPMIGQPIAIASRSDQEATNG